MANETPAAWRHVATARATFWFRVSNAAAQPTQYRTSRSSRPPAAATDATTGTSNGSDFVHANRSDDGWPQGLPWFSMARNAAVSSVGNRLSSRTRFRRNPTILSTCSMSTGHASTHAPHVTQSQTASYGIALSTIGAARATADGDLSSRPYVSRTIGELGM